MKLVGCALVAACAAAVPTRVDDPIVTAPAIPRASFTVVAAELADSEAVDRIRHRARLRRYGNGTLELGEPPRDDVVFELPWRPIVPVIGETRDRVRIVVASAGARLAIWIAKADLVPTVRAPIELADEHGRASPATGVWLEPGAPLDLESGGRVALAVDGIRASGWVPKQVVGDVWIAPPGEDVVALTESHAQSTSEPDGDVSTGVPATTAIVAAPRDGAPVIAIVTEPMHVVVIGERGAWREIEVRRRFVRIRGFVPAERVFRHLVAVAHGGGTGVGYGGGRTLVIETPAGICLYDEPDGEIVGVTTIASTRQTRRGGNGWWPLQLSTRWGTLPVVVRDLAAATDPYGAKLESCTR